MSEAPRIGLFGTFDVENYGDLLFPRIFDHELRRRIPGCHIRHFSPFGSEHPVRMNGGWSPECMGQRTTARLATLANELDLLVVGGGEIIHTRDELLAAAYDVDPLELRLRRPSEFFLDGLADEEARCPVIWHAVGVPFDFDAYEQREVRQALERRPYVAVRDRHSWERVRAAGVQREIAVVPDSAFVLDRLYERHRLDRERESLRASDRYPPGRPLVVQGSAALLEHVDTIAGGVNELSVERRGLDVVVVETGGCHGDDRFADALLERLDRPPYRLGSDASLEQMAAAIAGGSAYAGISMHGAITALVYGVPPLMLDIGHTYYSKLAGLADLVGDERLRVTEPAHIPGALRTLVSSASPDVAPLQQRVDAHFDEIVHQALSAARRAAEPPPPPVPPGRTALELSRRRLIEERRRYAELVGDVAGRLNEVSVELTEAKRYIASLEEALITKETEVAQLQEHLSALHAHAPAPERAHASSFMTLRRKLAAVARRRR